MKPIFFLFGMLLMINKLSFAQNKSVPAFDKQGHRGCRGLMPENTIPAMLHALELGVTTLEMDVVISKDNQVLLSHEPFFNHEISTKPNGEAVMEREEKQLNIFRMNYTDIKKYDVGMLVHPRFSQQQKMKAYKPLLSEMFDSVRAYCGRKNRPLPFFNIETKSLPVGDEVYHPRPAEFVDLLMHAIQRAGMEAYVTIQSFDFRTLQYLHEKYPQMSTAMLIEEDDRRNIEAQFSALGFDPSIYSPHYRLVTESLLKFCHSRNIKVIPWTVNSKTEIQRLRKMGVDGIITDYPNLFE